MDATLTVLDALNAPFVWDRQVACQRYLELNPVRAQMVKHPSTLRSRIRHPAPLAEAALTKHPIQLTYG